MKYDLEKIEGRIKNKKKIHKCIKTAIAIVIILLFILNVLLGYYEYAERNNKIVENKKYFFNIVSESMKPYLNINDIIIVEKNSYDNLNVGDVITYKKNNNIITHRIVQKEYINNQPTFITKGDRNETIDDERVYFENVYGKIIKIIPDLGIIVRFIQNRNGLIIMVGTIIIIFMIANMRENKRNDRKNKRKKYELKKKREEYK